MAEDLTAYLKDRGYKVAYLHSETKTLERTAIIYELRKGTYDVLVGINLLREGLDIPEVSLVAILDADKEGFLRSSRSLIQIIGRAARNANGTVIMYADSMTDSMNYAIEETKRRRAIQEKYNEENGIVPTTIIKDIAMPLGVTDDIVEELNNSNSKKSRSETKQDIKKLESQCKFTTCTHENKYGCAVLDAVDKGIISIDELNRYKKLKIKQSGKNKEKIMKDKLNYYKTKKSHR